MVIEKISKLTDCKYLKMYKLDIKNRKGNKKEYFVASRRDEKDLSCKTKKHDRADGVMIIPILNNEEFVVIKQFRPAINDYIYEFPAGLIDSGEDILTAAKRELFEETGLDVIDMEIAIKASYSSVGMTDEAIAVVKANVKGEISTNNIEEDEEIEIFKIKKEEMKHFIKENNVSIKMALAVLSI